MMFRTLVIILQYEHLSRYGAYPTRKNWMWEPWVGEFLRSAFDPPRVRVPTARKTL